MTITRKQQTHPCAICGKAFRLGELMPGELLHGKVQEKILADHPDWTPECCICQEDLNRYRRKFIEENLTTESGELDALQQQVMQSIKDNESVIKNLNTEFADKLSFGDRWRMESRRLGGELEVHHQLWGDPLFVWLLINTLTIAIMSKHPLPDFQQKPVRPLPLYFAEPGALLRRGRPAPVIMMSQNRQEAKDRMRSEQDFKTNLKSELEVRNLNAKIDELLTHQWQRLLEIQQIQVEMIEQMTAHHQWERELHEKASPVKNKE